LKFSSLLQKPIHSLDGVLSELLADVQRREEGPEAMTSSRVDVDLGLDTVLLQTPPKDQGFVAERVHAGNLSSSKVSCESMREESNTYLHIRWRKVVMPRSRGEHVPQAAVRIRLVDANHRLQLRHSEHGSILILFIANELIFVLLWDGAVVHDSGN
jgi:hypothetical protein